MAARPDAELCLARARVSGRFDFQVLGPTSEVNLHQKIAMDSRKSATNLADLGYGQTRAGPHPGQRVRRGKSLQAET
jgi:hypothetical protein